MMRVFFAAILLLCAPARADEPRPFSPVVEAGGVIYLAGHLGIDPATGKLVKGGIRNETMMTLSNIRQTLASVDASMRDVVRCQVFLADMDDFKKMNEVYRLSFPTNPPARTTVAVAGLARGAKIEIECTAVREQALLKQVN